MGLVSIQSCLSSDSCLACLLLLLAVLPAAPSMVLCTVLTPCSASDTFSASYSCCSLRCAAGPAGTAPSSRGCKYALNVLLQGIAVHEVSMALPQVCALGWKD